MSHFWVRNADFQSAFNVFATMKPAASRRSGLSAFRAAHENVRASVWKALPPPPRDGGTKIRRRISIRRYSAHGSFRRKAAKFRCPWRLGGTLRAALPRPRDRGRDAGCPAPPRTDPGGRFSRAKCGASHLAREIRSSGLMRDEVEQRNRQLRSVQSARSTSPTLPQTGSQGRIRLPCVWMRYIFWRR